jgi:hypothetical protein
VVLPHPATTTDTNTAAAAQSQRLLLFKIASLE